MSELPNSLRDCLSIQPCTITGTDLTCAKLFRQAEDLARGLFDLSKGGKVIIPYFTEHNIPHLERVEHILNQIIFSSNDLESNAAFIPVAEEAMYLLAGAWLHDIGMIYGIFPNEPLPPSDDWRSYRDRHEYRSSDFIQDRWDLSDWTPEQKTYLAELCIHHRRRHSLDKMSPITFTGGTGSEIRLRHLAALLRIADACHIDTTRAPGELKSLYTALHMPPDARVHWSMPKLVHDVHFNHATKTIQPICLIPRPKVFGTLTVDFKTVVDSLLRGLRDELRGVLPHLLRYTNTAFKEIEPTIDRPLALANPEKFMLEMWPYMLTTPSTATEVSCMIAVLVRALLTNRNAVPAEDLCELLDNAMKIHAYNFLVRRLDEKLRQFIASATPVEEVRRYLTTFLEDRVRACREVAFRAKKYVNASDTLVIYGYSHTIMTLLTEHLMGHEGKILLVECRRRQSGQTQIPDESQRVLDGLAPAGFRCTHVRMASLPAIFSDYEKRNVSVKVLLGASGVFNGRSVLSIAGNRLIGLIARASKFPVYVLAEQDKVMSNQVVDNLIQDRLRDFAAELTAITDGPALSELVPQIDCLEYGIYTELIGPELADVTRRSAEAGADSSRPLEPGNPGGPSQFAPADQHANS